MAATDQYSVENIFPVEKLVQFNASNLVKSLTPDDFEDMAKAFGMPPVDTGNPKLANLTMADLVSIEGLFVDYRGALVASFRGIHEVAARPKIPTCCCCTSPCCCCTCVEI